MLFSASSRFTLIRPAKYLRRVIRLFWIALAVECLLNAEIATAAAQSAKTEEKPPQTVEEPAAAAKFPAQQDAEKNKSGSSIVIAPLPISSPALGVGIVPVFAYIFSLVGSEDGSPPSLLGGAGLVTDNGSRAMALGGQFYFKKNAYRTMGIFVRGNLNYDLYGLGSGDSQPRLLLKQEGQALLAEFLRRTWWEFFAGPRFVWGSSLITVRDSRTGNVSLPPDVGLHTTLTALGFRIIRDTRPNRFYPTGGSLIDFTADFFAESLGSKYSFQSYKFTFNKYASLGEKQVLAYNFFTCSTGGQPPFYGNCIYGTNNELRGYVAGRYLSRYMVATQLEYRLTLPKRFGVVAFGGLGEVIPGGNQPFRVKNFLPSAGAGGRFLLSRQHHVNLRVDFAEGKESHTWSVGVSEAF